MADLRFHVREVLNTYMPSDPSVRYGIVMSLEATSLEFGKVQIPDSKLVDNTICVEKSGIISVVILGLNVVYVVALNPL